MFKLFRRVSSSLFPRPDRPWGEDATSHAPTIGRKRRYSVTEQDARDSASPTPKRAKGELAPDTDRGSASEEGAERDLIPPVEGQDVKEVTKGVKEVDLEDEDKAEDLSSIRPEGVPLPDSPSASPEPESEPPEVDVAEEPKEEQRTDDVDSVASSSPEGDMEGVADGIRTTEESIIINTDMLAGDPALPQEPIVATVALGLHDTRETLEVSA